MRATLQLDPGGFIVPWSAVESTSLGKVDMAESGDEVWATVGGPGARIFVRGDRSLREQVKAVALKLVEVAR